MTPLESALSELERLLVKWRALREAEAADCLNMTHALVLGGMLSGVIHCASDLRDALATIRAEHFTPSAPAENADAAPPCASGVTGRASSDARPS